MQYVTRSCTEIYHLRWSVSQSSQIKTVSAATDKKPDSPNTTRCVGRTSRAPPDCRALHPSVGTYRPISGLQVAAGLQDTRSKNHLLGRLPVSAAPSSSHARTIAPSSGLPVLGKFECCVLHHRPPEATFTKAHGWTLLVTIVSSIFFSIPPGSSVDPAVQSTSLSRHSIEQSIPPPPSKMSGFNLLVPGLHRTRCNVMYKCSFIMSKNGTKYDTMKDARYTVRCFERQPVS